MEKVQTHSVDMELFNQHLFDYLDSKVPFHKDIIHHLAIHRGKQLRAKLALLCALLGGELNSKSYKAAMSAELIHISSLLHDDIVDNSDQRRNAPSVNAKWSNKKALFSGQIISMQAVLLNLNESDIDIFVPFGKIINPLVEAELLQLKKSSKINTSEEDYFKIIRAKTALLFSASCEAGAVSNFTNSNQIEKLRQIGEYIGMAFQIRDDLFGYFTTETGKPNHNDFQEKKATLPLIYTMNNVNIWKKWKLKRSIKSNHLNERKIASIIDEVKKHNGIQYAQKKMIQFANNALTLLKDFPPSNARFEIEQIIHFTTRRNH
ncbi:polyprenyl synthetase family protein [bacterium SCSIO 12643]|nr:polyprenyl synthetase family protein [bacterium SCSIO 12643]